MMDAAMGNLDPEKRKERLAAKKKRLEKTAAARPLQGPALHAKLAASIEKTTSNIAEKMKSDAMQAEAAITSANALAKMADVMVQMMSANNQNMPRTTHFSNNSPMTSFPRFDQ